MKSIIKPRGTIDWLKSEGVKLYNLQSLLIDIAASYNFQFISTPLYESKQLFKRGVGGNTDIVQKEMFELQDRKQRAFVLRPEATAGITRAVIENKLLLTEALPIKMCYFGPMFRYERPQAGRMRQFFQFGVELFGPKSYYQDCEVLKLASDILHKCQVKDFVLEINFLPTGSQRSKYINDLIASVNNQKLCADCLRRIKKNPLRILDCKVDQLIFSHIPDMTNYLTEHEQQYFKDLTTCLDDWNIQYEINRRLVRGLDYYNGLVFELNLKNRPGELAASIIGGGHYDRLVNFLDPSVQSDAIGFAIGIERLLMASAAADKLFALNQLDFMILPLSNDRQLMNYAAQIAQELRFGCGYKTIINYAGGKLKQQFRMADRRQALYLVIVGNEELKTQTMQLKNNNNKTSQVVSFKDLKTVLQNGKKI